EGSLVLGDVLQRNVGAVIPALAVLVVQHGVPVGEGAATGILTGDAHSVAAGDQGGEGKMLAHAPVDACFAANHGATVVQQPVDQRQIGRASRGVRRAP